MAKNLIFYLKSGAIVSCPGFPILLGDLEQTIGKAKIITVKTLKSTVIIPIESISFVEIKEEDAKEEVK